MFFLFLPLYNCMIMSLNVGEIRTFLINKQKAGDFKSVKQIKRITFVTSTAAVRLPRHIPPIQNKFPTYCLWRIFWGGDSAAIFAPSPFRNRAVDATAPESPFLLPKRPRVRSLWRKLLRLISLKFNIQKCLEYPAFPFLDIVNFVLTEFIISVALNSGKLYGRMRKIAQAFTRARSGIKMAGYRKNVSAARFVHQLFFPKHAFPGSR